jgi:hypothetical protein
MGHFGSGAPAAVGMHCPGFDGLLQVWQVPSQALMQHTPSAQKPLSHSGPVVHGRPIGTLPQLLLTQVLPFAHWLLLLQTRTHWLFSHLDGLHGRATPFTQVPSPSQTPAGIHSLSFLHAASSQTVSGGYFAQPPCPLQTPLCPQVSGESLRQIWCGSSTPAPTGTHSPTLSGWLHDRHAPVHPTLQQTPSAQKPLMHWSALAHGEPSGRLAPQAAPLQQTPFTHSFVLQSVPQTQAWPASRFSSSRNTRQRSSGEPEEPGASAFAPPSARDGVGFC